MNKLLIVLLSAALAFSGCTMVKKLFGKKGFEGTSVGDVEMLRLAYQEGKLQALEELISMYNDSNLPFDVRIAAGKALAETHHPTALNALAKVVADAEALDLTLMEASIELLATFRDNPKAADAMVAAMHQVDEKSNHLYMTLVKNLNRVRTKDQVLALLDLYEAARSNVTRTDKLLAETLGAIGSQEVIPILVSIAKDPEINVGVRNRAVEILGRKNPQEVAVAFAELLGDPNTNLEVREFALNTIAGVREENLVLSLIDTYNMGKKQYYSLVQTLLEALGEFDDPQIKRAIVEIALSEDFPLPIRKKAIGNLGKMGDPSVVPPFLELLKDPRNYTLYYPIHDLIQTLGVQDQYQEPMRRFALQAQMQEGTHE